MRPLIGSLIITLLCILVTASGQTSARGSGVSPEAAEKAQVEVSREYYESGRFPEAIENLKRVLSSNPSDEEALNLLKQILEAQNSQDTAVEEQKLRQARWWIDNGEPEKAIDLLQKMDESAQDPKRESEIQKLLDDSRPNRSRRLWVWLNSKWIADFVVAIIFLALVLWLPRAVLSAWYSIRNEVGRPAWEFRAINDASNSGLGAVVLSTFSRFARDKDAGDSVSAGLIVGKALTIDSLVKSFSLRIPEVDPEVVSADFSLKMGEVELGGLARFLGRLGSWWRCDRPFITGLVRTVPGEPQKTIIQLSCYIGHRISTVSSSESQGKSPEACAEEVAFKMYYLISSPEATQSDAEGAEALREGLIALQQYVRDRQPSPLRSALELFATAKKELPEPLVYDAYLYEGVTLDLLERHQEAILRFEKILRDTPVEGPISQKALYNKAVANMRQYTIAGLQEAEKLFKSMSKDKFDPAKNAVKLFAKVGVANAVAHYPMFWKQILHPQNEKDDNELTLWKGAADARVKEWQDEVIRTVAEVKAVYPVISKPGEWDVTARRQLEWGCSNAIGNVHLYIAEKFLNSPTPKSWADVESTRARYLGVALSAFLECEMLLPAGVETLTNIATTHIGLKRFADARKYLDMAIELNREYEYAYYRKAETWKKEGHPDEFKRELSRYRGKVSIPKFKKMFEDEGLTVRL